MRKQSSSLINRLSVRGKLFLGFGLVVALFLVAMSFALWTLTEVYTASEKTIHEDTPKLLATQDVQYLVAHGHLRFEELMAGEGNATMQEVDSALGQASNLSRALLEGGTVDGRTFSAEGSAEIRKSVEALGQDLGAFKTTARDRYQAHASGDSTRAVEMEQRFDQAYTTVVDRAAAVRAQVEAELKSSEDAVASRYSIGLWSQGIVVVVGLFLALFIVFWISRVIVGCLREVMSVAEAVREGRLEHRVTVSSGDEIGELGHAVNDMIESISRQISYLDILPTPVMLVDGDMNVEYMNLAAAETVGSTQVGVVGKKCYDLYKTDHCQTAHCACKIAMENNRVTTSETIARPQGTGIDILYTGAPVRDSSGKVVGALEFVANITENKEAQRYLARSTEHLLEKMDRFAEGDLTVQAEPERTDDDIARLFSGFNRSVENLREMLLRVGDVVNATTTAATQISSAAEQLAAGTQEQSAQADEVSAAVEEMSRTVIENAESAVRASEAARTGGKVASEGSQVVQQTVDKIRRIAEVVTSSADSVIRLGTSSQQIGEITSVIDEIANQTNLLALNAAIEAARAGEQGRGFAVVADEVRKLAERTTLATKEITEMIKTVQVETEQAIRDMQQGNREVDEGIGLADQTGRVLQEIVSSVNDIDLMVAQIAAASEQQSSSSEQISRSVQNISTVSSESAAGVSQVAEAASGLSELTERLKGQISQFRVQQEPDRHGAGGVGVVSGGNRHVGIVTRAIR